MPLQEQQSSNTTVPSPLRQDRFSAAINSVSKGLLVGTAFGDAFGIPIECKTFHELSLLRKCWIDQVIHEHPELVPYHQRFASRTESVSPESSQSTNYSSNVPTSENKMRNNIINSTSCDEDDSGQNRNQNNSNNNNKNGMTRQNTTGPAMDQRTTSDDAGNNNTKQQEDSTTLNRTSSFTGGGGSSSLDEIPTPKNQPLAFTANQNLDAFASLVAPRDRAKLAPLAFAATIGHPFIGDEDNFEPGCWTDDTQLACAIARAIAHSLVPEVNKHLNSNNNNNNCRLRQQQQQTQQQRRPLRRTRLSDEEDEADEDENLQLDGSEDADGSSTSTMMNNSSSNNGSNINNNNTNDDDDEAASSGFLNLQSSSTLSKKSSNNKSTTSPMSGPKPPPTTSANINNMNNQLQQQQHSSNNNNNNVSSSSPSSSSPTAGIENNTNNSQSSSILLQLRSLSDGNLVCKNPEGLIANRLQFYHMAQEHVIEHQRSLVGWGGTRTAVARLIRPVEETREALSRADAKVAQKEILQRFNAHLSSGNEKATGNGVLMKLTPLSLVLGLEQALVRRAQGFLSREDKKAQQRNRIGAKEKLIYELTKMTHGSGDAIATALVHNEMLCSLFEDFFVSCVFTKNIESSSSTNKNSKNSHHHNNNKKNDQPSTSEQVHEDEAPPSSSSCANSNNNNNNNNNDKNDDDDDQLEDGESDKQNTNDGSPLFDRVQSSSKRAALVAALFQVAIDRGISFCEELSVGDVVPGDVTSSVISTSSSSKNNNNNNNNNISEDASSDPKATATGSSSNPSSSATASTTSTVKTNLIDLNFPESFAKIATALKKVKTFFSDLIRRHHDLAEEAWLQGDVFPFISRHEREEIENKIVEISEGGTFYCIHSLIFVWSYCACFGPCCAVNCARADIVPVAIAHSALLGGDTDSNAAMIGGIFGAIFGERSIAPHVNNLQHTEVLDEATKCLECSLNALLSGKLA